MNKDFFKDVLVIFLVTFFIICALFGLSIALSGCDGFDDRYNYAYIYTPDGLLIKEGTIKRYLTTGEGTVVRFRDNDIWYTGTENIMLTYKQDVAFDIIMEESKHDT